MDRVGDKARSCGMARSGLRKTPIYRNTKPQVLHNTSLAAGPQGVRTALSTG